MAHYARTTPPVHPPGRSLMPDQPWTAWWDIDDAELQAPGENRFGAPQAPAAIADIEAAAAALDRQTDPAPRPVDQPDPGQSEFPHADATGGGGLRRIGATTPQTQGNTSADVPANWGLVETAATQAATPAGVQTVYGRLSVDGVARRPGDLVFTGVTFPDPVTTVPARGAVYLTIVEVSNVAPDGVVVADMDGFTPDRQGFTLITTALGAGPVRVDGHYVVEI
jgi:hypothetical protein